MLLFDNVVALYREVYHSYLRNRINTAFDDGDDWITLREASQISSIGNFSLKMSAIYKKQSYVYDYILQQKTFQKCQLL